jgi:hypothetical protein
MTGYISFEDHQHLEGKWYYDIELSRFSVINTDCVTILGLPQKYSKYNDWGQLEDINDALFLQQTHPEDRLRVVEHQKKMINSDHAKEDTLIHRWIRPDNGQIITISDRVIPVFDEDTGQVHGLRGVLKRVKDSESKKEYRPLSRWRLNLIKMEFDYISDEIKAMYGVLEDKDTPYEYYLHHYVHIDDRQWIEQQRLKLVHGEQRVELRNYRCIRQDTGEVVEMNSDCFAVRDEEDNLIAIEGWTWQAN